MFALRTGPITFAVVAIGRRLGDGDRLAPGPTHWHDCAQWSLLTLASEVAVIRRRLKRHCFRMSALKTCSYLSISTSRSELLPVSSIVVAIADDSVAMPQFVRQWPELEGMLVRELCSEVS